jgi:hypothetical protein
LKALLNRIAAAQWMHGTREIAWRGEMRVLPLQIELSKRCRSRTR